MTAALSGNLPPISRPIFRANVADDLCGTYFPGLLCAGRYMRLSLVLLLYEYSTITMCVGWRGDGRQLETSQAIAGTKNGDARKITP